MSVTPIIPQDIRVKRSSIEMDQDEPMMDIRDDAIAIEEDKPLVPPKKQVLTERKLFKRFGSLHLDPSASYISESDDSDEDNDNISTSPDNNNDTPKSIFEQGREEFQRYVCLLYKESKNKGWNHVPMTASLAAIERLAKEERNKLSKALVLWNPPVENHFNLKSSLPNECDSNGNSDDDFTYTDHTSFLKDFQSENSIIITDVTDQICSPSLPINDEPSCIDPDDLMID